MQDVALNQSLPLYVCCFPVPGGSVLLCYVVLPSSTWSSPLSLPSPGYHSVHRLVYLLSFILAICPAHLHFCFSVYSQTSVTFVLFLISEHGTLSCSFKFNMFLSTAPWALLTLSVVYKEAMFGSHMSLLVRHIGSLLVFSLIWGVLYLEVFPFLPKQVNVDLILA